MDPYEAIPRVILALVLGAIVGLEREFTQKSAGLRTHILVTLGATIFTIVSLSDFYAGLHSAPYISSVHTQITRDPSRVAAQIVPGIGFIGGGAVLRYGTTIRGLTTAASLWIVASIGMLVGIGQYRLSIFTTLAAFLVLFTIGRIERHYFGKLTQKDNRLRLHISVQSMETPLVQSWLDGRFPEHIIETKVKTERAKGMTDLTYLITCEPGKANINDLSKSLSQMSGVQTVTAKSYFESEDSA